MVVHPRNIAEQDHRHDAEALLRSRHFSPAPLTDDRHATPIARQLSSTATPRCSPRALLGKIIRHRHQGHGWLRESSRPRPITWRKRAAMPAWLHREASRPVPRWRPYLHVQRGGDSLNFSAQGPGNAVLIKSALPWLDVALCAGRPATHAGQQPGGRSGERRPPERLCAGQTLRCAGRWAPRCRTGDAQRFDPRAPVRRRRRRTPGANHPALPCLGIPRRDEHLPHRFVDATSRLPPHAQPAAPRPGRRPTTFC